MGSWNVLATSLEGRRDALLIALRRLGKFRRGGYRNVIVGQVEDVSVFLVAVREALASEPLLPTALARVVPVETIVRFDPMKAADTFATAAELVTFPAWSVTLALPGARLGAMPATGGGAAAGVDDDAQSVLDHAELGGAYSSADAMSYDEVIEPRELRNALLAALRLASRRRSVPPEPARHHGIRP